MEKSRIQRNTLSFCNFVFKEQISKEMVMRREELLDWFEPTVHFAVRVVEDVAFMLPKVAGCSTT